MGIGKKIGIAVVIIGALNYCSARPFEKINNMTRENVKSHIETTESYMKLYDFLRDKRYNEAESLLEKYLEHIQNESPGLLEKCKSTF